MIHAYLFVADKNRDRGEHGPKFHEHMHRINKEAGTKITVSLYFIILVVVEDLRSDGVQEVTTAFAIVDILP